MCISNKISLHLYQPFRCGSYEHQMIENKWDGLGLDGKGYSHFFFGIQMNCSFREKIGKRTQWISRSVFVKMWIFWFLSINIYVSSLLSWTTKTTTNAYSDNTRTRNENQPIIGSSITPHVLIHKCAMSNSIFHFIFPWFIIAKYFYNCISAIVKSIELYITQNLLIITSLVRQSESTIGWQFLSE